MSVKTVFLFLLPLLSTGCALGPSAATADASGARLALLQSANQWMRQGSSNHVNVIVRRTGFTDAIDVRFRNLPPGVRVEGSAIDAGDSSKDFLLVADASAAIVADHPVTIEATGHGLTTSQTFQLSVKSD